MKEKINVMAVFCDDTNRITRFDAMTHFVFYSKAESGWRQSDRVPFSCDLSGGLASIRENISQMLGAFNDCRIIITQSIAGIPYQIFDRSGFIICESETFDLELLDAIQADLLRQDAEIQEDTSLLVKTPEETDVPGYYLFDLTQLQKKHPEISSKKALLPFLKETAFYTLEVICDHIPPWFEQQLPKMQLQYRIENKNDSTQHVVITHVACE
ncbi:Fe-only nitrogenase accessory AnfO family protein [Acetobacterium sp.]|uniref:Fe-only nitrogenase accessory AnfO family protein n=1 Tax=Acetobacterium sp. TaxID=1872094 RepID=UPI0035933A16